jgi:hypothetical protein
MNLTRLYPSPISRNLWYRCTLFLPFLVPAVLWLAVGIIHHFIPNPWSADGHRSIFQFVLELLNAFYIYLFSAVIVAGLQYLAFVAALLWWGRRKTADEFRATAGVLPILFIPVLALGGTLLKALSQHSLSLQALWTDVGMGIGLSVFALPIGYFYVGFAILPTHLLQKNGWVLD